MTEIKVDAEGVLSRAVDATPKWVWALTGVQIVTTICTVAMLQLTGFAGPLQRIVNAQAQQIETAATSMAVSASKIEVAMLDHEQRIISLEKSVQTLKGSHQ